MRVLSSPGRGALDGRRKDSERVAVALALAALAAAALELLSLPGDQHGAAVGVVHASCALACVMCAVHMVRARTTGAVRTTVLMSLAQLVMASGVLGQLLGGSGGHHQLAAAASGTWAPTTGTAPVVLHLVVVAVGVRHVRRAGTAPAPRALLSAVGQAEPASAARRPSSVSSVAPSALARSPAVADSTRA